MSRFILSLIVSIIFLSCDTPFSTKPSNEETLFVVSHNYDQSPIYHKTAVEVSWSNITVENFKEFRIEKAKIIGDDYIWNDLARIIDSLETSYIDTLDDDGTSSGPCAREYNSPIWLKRNEQSPPVYSCTPRVSKGHRHAPWRGSGWYMLRLPTKWRAWFMPYR